MTCLKDVFCCALAPHCDGISWCFFMPYILLEADSSKPLFFFLRVQAGKEDLRQISGCLCPVNSLPSLPRSRCRCGERALWAQSPSPQALSPADGNLGISRVAIWKHVWQTFWQNTKNIDVYVIILYVWVLTLTNNVLAFEVFMSSSSLLLFGCSVQNSDNSVMFLCKSRLFLVLFVVLNTVCILPQSQNKLRESKCPKYMRQQHCLLPSHANDLSWQEIKRYF